MSDISILKLNLRATRIDGHWRGNSAYFEAKYVAPHNDQGFYWGAEVDAGTVNPKGEERSAVLEVLPILGFRARRYHLTANPSFEFCSEGEDPGWEFSPKLKLAYELAKGSHVGLEYHVDAGKLINLAPRARRTETAYLTFDSRFAGQKFNLAMGHGTTNQSDRWVVRIGVEFDD